MKTLDTFDQPLSRFRGISTSRIHIATAAAGGRTAGEPTCLSVALPATVGPDCRGAAAGPSRLPPNRRTCRTRRGRFGPLLLTAAAALLACPPQAADAQCTIDEQARLVPDGIGISTVESGDFFGASLSATESTAIIGAYGDSDGGHLAGAAYIYQRVGDQWTQTFKIKPQDGRPEDQFGFAVATLEQTALVGAYNANAGAIQSGTAYVFQRTDSGWTQAAKLRPHDGSSYDHFGYAVAMNRDLALVGSPQGPIRGSAYLFQREGSVWTQTAKLIAPDATPDSRFGHCVSMHERTLLIGAPGDAPHGPASGSAFLYERINGAWIRAARLSAADGSPNDHFGISVCVFGEYAVVGADRDVDRGVSTGSAYVFQRDGVAWRQIAKLTPDDPIIDARFGAAVALRGGTALVTAPNDDNGSFRAGTAYMYHVVDSDWQRVNRLELPRNTPNTQFGVSAAMSGQTLLIGSLRHIESDRYTGSVFAAQIGGCCVPIGGTSCGARPRECVETTEACCLSLGGEFVGVGVACEHAELSVNHDGPRGGWSHKIIPVSDCPSGQRGDDPCVSGPVMIDPWISAAGATTNCEDFGGPTGCPIPADFFGAGSDVFHGRVCLHGMPLGQVTLPQFGATLDFNNADTLVMREFDPFESCDTASSGTRELKVAVERLRMASCDPVLITYHNGMNPEPWTVEAEVSSSDGQPEGKMTARLEHCNGGTFDSELRVCPRFVFRKVGDPNEVRIIDYCESCNEDGIRITSTDVPWVKSAQRNLKVISPVCSAFHPGIKELEPQTDCDCNLNGQRDECDVQQGASPDCNHNGRPDECDPESRDMAVFVSMMTRGIRNPTVLCFYDMNHDGQLNSQDIPAFVARLLRP